MNLPISNAKNNWNDDDRYPREDISQGVNKTTGAKLVQKWHTSLQREQFARHF
jgi:hypothetical protein